MSSFILLNGLDSSVFDLNIYTEVGKAIKPPLSPNRTCGSPAYGSPVGSFLIGTDALVYGLSLL